MASVIVIIRSMFALFKEQIEEPNVKAHTPPTLREIRNDVPRIFATFKTRDVRSGRVQRLVGQRPWAIAYVVVRQQPQCTWGA